MDSHIGYGQPIRLTAGSRDVYLLRLDTRATLDVYATQAGESGQELAAAWNPHEVLHLAARQGVRVRRQRALWISLDAMDAALDRLSRTTFISDQLARSVLDGWHALDDLSRTLGLGPTCSAGALATRTPGLYDRFFCANTFPANSFGASPPPPAVQAEEMEQLHTILRDAWQQVSGRTKHIAAPPWRPPAVGQALPTAVFAGAGPVLRAA